MWEFITGPYFRITIGVIIIGIIVTSIIINKRREQEVAEMDRLFPENVIDTSEKISVEKVRRASNRRKQRNLERSTQPTDTHDQSRTSLQPSAPAQLSSPIETNTQTELTDHQEEIEKKPLTQRSRRRDTLPTIGRKITNSNSETSSNSELRSRRSPATFPKSSLSRSSRKSSPSTTEDSASNNSFIPRRKRFSR